MKRALFAPNHLSKPVIHTQEESLSGEVGVGGVQKGSDLSYCVVMVNKAIAQIRSWHFKQGKKSSFIFGLLLTVNLLERCE